MARGDLLLTLVKTGLAGERDTFRASVEALVADERAKSHNALADRLQRALNTVAVTPPPLSSVMAVKRDEGRDTLMELTPSVRLNDLLLTLPARRAAEQLIEEHQRAEVLRAYGMEPRHRVLLAGPPGNGKTSFAEAIAEELALPLMVVRYDALIGSYLGETNARLRKLFDTVRPQRCVLFFDEFDAIGKERGDTHETGEIKRVVSFLLMQLDQLPSHVITIAATNHAELLDRAVWRRFQMRLDFPAPDKKRLSSYIGMIFSGWNEPPHAKPSYVAGKIGRVSFAEASDFCQNVRRRYILGLGEASIDSILKDELELWASRINPMDDHGQEEETDRSDLEPQRSDQAVDSADGDGAA